MVNSEAPLNNVNELPDPNTYTGEYGDAYIVGTQAPFDLYVYSRSSDPNLRGFWFDWGPLNAPSVVPGPIGPQGMQGKPGVRGSLWYSQTGKPTIIEGVNKNDQAIDGTNGDIYQFVNDVWQLTGNIRGPQGIPGIQGQVGPQGPEGPQGPKGKTGDVGGFINIYGILDNVNQLPTPESLKNLSIAYLVGASAPYDLYIQAGSTPATARWNNAGPFNAATLVFENGEAQNTWDADTKLNKVTITTATAQVYAKMANGGQMLISVDNSNTANDAFIPSRASYGAIYIPDTSIGKSYKFPAGQEAVNKNYVDNSLPDVVSEDMINSLF